MKTKEYVKKFQLDDARFANQFNTNLFLEDFDQEFRKKGPARFQLPHFPGIDRGNAN